MLLVFLACVGAQRLTTYGGVRHNAVLQRGSRLAVQLARGHNAPRFMAGWLDRSDHRLGL